MAKIPSFGKFTVSERGQIVEFAQVYVADQNEAIIEKNAKDNCFYVLLSGQGRVCIEKDATAIAKVQPGEIFGEMGFVLNAPRSTWIFADQMCALLRIDQKLLNSLDAVVRDKMKDQIIHKLAKTIESINSKLK